MLCSSLCSAPPVGPKGHHSAPRRSSRRTRSCINKASATFAAGGGGSGDGAGGRDGSSIGSSLPAALQAGKEISMTQKQLAALRAQASGADNNGSGDGGADGNGAGGSPASSNGKTVAGSPREPCLPPLPYWADGVAVVGRPGGELVFRFLTAAETAAAARRRARPEERPEAPYGPCALKLVVMPGDKCQAILDRWQYAVAQRELASLDASRPCWCPYESLWKGLVGSGSWQLQHPGDDAPQPERPEGQEPQAQAQGQQRQQQQPPSMSRRQRRRAAKLGRAAGAEPPAPGAGGVAAAAQQQPAEARSPAQVAASAFDADWAVCTVRGRPDGTLIYKFGDFEPLSSAILQRLPPEQAAAAAATMARPPLASQGEYLQWRREQRRRREEQHGTVGELLWQQQRLRSLEGLEWSSATRLGVVFKDQTWRALRKLNMACRELPQQPVFFGNGLHPSYEKIIQKHARREAAAAAAAAAGEPAGAASAGARKAQQAWRPQPQPQPPTKQQVDGESPQEQRESQQAALSSSRSNEAAAAAAAAAAPQPSFSEGQRQAEQLPKPALPASPTSNQQARHASAAPAAAGAAAAVEATEGAATAGGSGSAARPEQPWLWAALAAVAAPVVVAAAALCRLLHEAVRGLGAFILALYRCVPVTFRRLFWRSWPPKWPGHVSASLECLISSKEAKWGAKALEAAGFDTQGRTVAPLADLQAWQVERLTLCAVGDLDLYRAAFTHKSALPTELRVEKSFERLEFLGDSVLGLACRTLLMRRCPGSNEGDMTSLASMLVSGSSNARYGSWLGLDRYLQLELRCHREGMQYTPAILADCMEALLGALYLDQGFEAAQAWMHRVLDSCNDWERLEAAAADWKGLLCRYASMHREPQPRYKVRTSQRQYKGGLQLTWWDVETTSPNGEVLGRGGSFDKRSAEQAAAREALRALFPELELPGGGGT